MKGDFAFVFTANVYDSDQELAGLVFLRYCFILFPESLVLRPCETC